MILSASDRLVKSLVHKRGLELLPPGDKRLRRMPAPKNDEHNANRAEDKQDDGPQLRISSIRNDSPEASTMQSLDPPSRANPISLKTMKRLDAFRHVPLAETLPTESPHSSTFGPGTANQNGAEDSLTPNAHLSEHATPDKYNDHVAEDFDIDIDEEVFDEILSADAIDQLCLTGAPTQPVVSTPPQPPEPPKIISTTISTSPSLAISFNRPPIAPFLRASLPKPTSSTSLIHHLHPSLRVLTLFRTAEVHRLLSTLPPHTSQRIELYATVTSSTRDSRSTDQLFRFADLFFPHRPPYLHGNYARCAASALFNADTAPFLDCDEKACRTRLCRAIIQIEGKRAANGGTASSPLGSSPLPGMGFPASAQPLDVAVLNIWEAGWEDVEYAKGIVEEI